jgi:hypothetical protein
MSSSLMADRQRILDALEAAGVAYATGGQLAPPCVVVEPGSPWSTPDRLPGRRSRWRLTLFAGAATGSLDQLAELVDQVDTALRPVTISSPTWGQPYDTRPAEPNAVRYAVSVATVELVTEAAS